MGFTVKSNQKSKTFKARPGPDLFFTGPQIKAPWGRVDLSQGSLFNALSGAYMLWSEHRGVLTWKVL